MNRYVQSALFKIRLGHATQYLPSKRSVELVGTHVFLQRLFRAENIAAFVYLTLEEHIFVLEILMIKKAKKRQSQPLRPRTYNLLQYVSSIQLN